MYFEKIFKKDWILSKKNLFCREFNSLQNGIFYAIFKIFFTIFCELDNEYRKILYSKLKFWA